MPKKKICFVTSSRADYGLLRLTLLKIAKSQKFDLQLLVTGTHLSPLFGSTFREIENDGFLDYKTANIISDKDDALSMAQSMGQAQTLMAEIFADLTPDLVMVLGDRFEILAASLAAYTLGIPVGHFHGGEITGGARDEGYRHAITKLASLHFVATDSYRNRVVQMGEPPDSVFVIGAPGLELLRLHPLIETPQLSKSLDFVVSPKEYLVVAYHPETNSRNLGIDDFEILLNALSDLSSRFKILFSKSNADAGGRRIGKLIDRFVKAHPERATAFTSLGHLKFMSLIKNSAAMIGNSSSGIIEAPALKVPTLNIGNRQAGRLLASSIKSVPSDHKLILETVNVLTSKDFTAFDYLPYGDGENVSDLVLQILTENISKVRSVKNFYDLGGFKHE